MVLERHETAVHAENRQFHLCPAGEPWFAEILPGGNGLAYGQDGGVQVITGVEMGRVAVLVEYDDEPIAAPSDLSSWSEVVEVGFTAPGPLAVRSYEDEGEVVVPGRGEGSDTYRCRVFATSRDATYDLVVDDAETYLLQVWPSLDVGDETVDKLSDRVGQERRTC